VEAVRGEPGGKPRGPPRATAPRSVPGETVSKGVIPKADGRLRPLGIASLEDNVVQRAVVEVMNAIYEEDFLGFSYGFRPGRGQHDALDALAVALGRRKVNWVLDADIRGFLDASSHCTSICGVIVKEAWQCVWDLDS
jgi:hypothetical protein